MTTSIKRTTDEKIALFMRYFVGRTDVYGTYDPETGKVRQVKAPVKRDVIYKHLKGLQSYGVYLLIKDRISAMVVDFDQDDLLLVKEYTDAARQYEIPVYIERSKAKGYHAWTFFKENGVLASKARRVALHLLEEIEHPKIEVFPKQNSLNGATQYGNFINAPYFGALVPKGRTIFINEEGSFEPYPDPWDFLESIRRIPEKLLDEIIELNEINLVENAIPQAQKIKEKPQAAARTFGLLPCYQRILNEGVTFNQRPSCFRLAVQLRKAGLPYDVAVGALKVWATKNRPENGKRIISEREIIEQTSWVYNKKYLGCGCEEPAIAKFCDRTCPVYQEGNKA